MTLFALVHGGAGGGWQWDEVARELTARGHTAVAPDIPVDDPAAGAADWAEVVTNAIDAANPGDAGDVIVVGHSQGGLAIPVVAARRPVKRMVFLCAMVPMPGAVFGEWIAGQPGAITLPVGDNPVDEQGRVQVSWPVARACFYQDLPEELGRELWKRLRPNAARTFTEQCPLDDWPDVPSSYILAKDDRAVGPDWSRRVCRERLGVTPVEIEGGHMPFHTRAAEVAQALHAVA